MIMKVRLEVLKNKKPEQYQLSKKYFEFLGKRTQQKDDASRMKMHFNFWCIFILLCQKIEFVNVIEMEYRAEYIAAIDFREN